MGVQTFATARNSDVEFFVQFILESFFENLQKEGQLKNVDLESQKPFTSPIASDVWDHFISAVQADGRPIQIWCQTTCYKGNGTGAPEPNKTYEVRETLVEGLSVRKIFAENPGTDYRSLHFTVGDSQYTYQWFLELKASIYDASLYIGESQYNIFLDISNTLSGAYTEAMKTQRLTKCVDDNSNLGTFIKKAWSQLDCWWRKSDHEKSSLADLQWKLIEHGMDAASASWSDLKKIQGQDIKGRTNRAVFEEGIDTSDPLILKTAAKLLKKKPFLSSAFDILGSWERFLDNLTLVAIEFPAMRDFVATLWNSAPPERLVIRRLLVRIHTQDAIAYVQDRDIAGISEHNLYSGEHNQVQVKEICTQIIEALTTVGVHSPGELISAIGLRGKKLISQARWFEAKNGTELKPSFDYVQLALEEAGYKVQTPSAAKLRAIGYHSEIATSKVRPYNNLRIVKDANGKFKCVLKAKFFRTAEFARRCKEEAFVGLTLKYSYTGGVFRERLNVPLVMFIDMATDCTPPAHAVKRLISFGWHVVFSIDELITYLESIQDA